MKTTNNLISTENQILNPSWVTVFTDAEGCFSVILTQRSNSKWRIMVSFEINLDKKDIAILHSLRDYFGVGSVYSSPNRSLCLYRVNKIDDLINVIIPHFVDYPLLTQKYSDFVLWSKVVNKEHLTPTGFNTILTYYASINKGMTSKVSSQFPNIVGVEKVENNALNSTIELNPFWVTGFTAGK